MNYKTMKMPEDVWRSIKIGAAREGVTMIEYLRRKVSDKKAKSDWRDTVSHKNSIECFVSDGDYILQIEDGDYSGCSKELIIGFDKDSEHSYKTWTDSFRYATPVNTQLRKDGGK